MECNAKWHCISQWMRWIWRITLSFASCFVFHVWRKRQSLILESFPTYGEGKYFPIVLLIFGFIEGLGEGVESAAAASAAAGPIEAATGTLAALARSGGIPAGSASADFRV